MSASNAATTTTTAAAESTSDEAAAKAVHKRYEGLVMVRTKAIKGKGAWYWAHLEPILVNNSDTGLPKAVKLKCSLCDAVFSASNPSRTASEHLKRGTCPNFASLPKPISSIPSSSSLAVATTSPSPSSSHTPRKRASSSRAAAAAAATTFSTDHVVQPLSIVDPSRFTVDLAFPPTVSLAGTSVAAAAGGASCGYYSNQQQQQLVLSGGKEDLGSLARFEDSVKRLKSPKASSGPTLTKSQVDSALDLLADWAYDCCGSISFSILEHPKFKAFLNHVGLPPSISRRDFLGPRLDAKYEEAKAESDAKIRDAMFFQIASDGWRPLNSSRSKDVVGEHNFVHLAVNLPNGTTLFRRTVFTAGYVPSKHAQDILWDTITEICGTNNVHQCVGIVSDKFKADALRNLENEHHWMVNLFCQHQGFTALIKDFGKELPLFRNVAENCSKLLSFIHNKPQIRRSLYKYQMQEYGHAGLLRSAPLYYESSDFGPVYTMVEDILSSARALQLVLMDESYKNASTEEPIAQKIEEMMRNPHFWNELEAVHSLVKLVRAMAQEIETERPRIGQCLPLWEELRVKVRDWCSKFHIIEPPVEKVIEKRFKKNYHPAWAAAFILDPLYLIRDSSGKYLPPFKCLTAEQEKDVDKLITRLVSREEAHIALMELMKWRTEGLDPVYAQAVQLKQRDPSTGKMKIANPQSSRLVWETYLTEFKSLGKVAVRLIFLHATSSSSSCVFKCNGDLMRWIGHPRVGMDKAQKLVFVYAHSKMDKRDLQSGDGGDKETELFSLPNGEDDVLNEVFVDTSSVKSGVDPHHQQSGSLL